MLKKIIEDKRILALYIFVFIALFLGFTYALSDTSSLAINIETALIGVDEDAYGDTSINTSDIDFKPIIDTEVELRDGVVVEGVEEKEEVNVIRIDFSVGGASTNELTDIIYDIALVDLEFDDELLSPYIKWKLVRNGSNIASGNFEEMVENDRLVLNYYHEDLPVYSGTKEGYHNYSFYMWFSDSCQNEDLSTCFNKIDQNELVGKNFKGKIEIELYTYNSNEIQNNAPVLDSNSLLPVYYDESGTYTESDGTSITGVWRKADSSNPNNSWYNYKNKSWANAVLISNSSSTDYGMSGVNTIVKESDIDAFYVWIPRFKYKVWNITRQAGDISTYAYDAFTNGIRISFEKGTSSTGNVECIYNTNNTSSSTVLSDQCYYGKSKIAISPTDNNSDYLNAWYTHPAFTFGGTEKTGFWIGKFETSGWANEPQILPDKVALRNQNVSAQFTTSKKFQSRFINLDAHVLTNLEWGAVAYLTHSTFGTCDGTICTGVNQNNSSGYYTGRSGGAPANSDLLTLNNVYGTGGENKYNNFGYYDYKGYKLDSTTGKPTTSKDINKVASTTKNPTGVYDMSGGAWDNVMGNQVNSSYTFQPSSSGTSWNGSATLDSKYYNAYSYSSSYIDQIAYNKARLGDATAEVLGGVGTFASWNISLTGAYSGIINTNWAWERRGGTANDNNSGIFGFSNDKGANSSMHTFRSSLS